MCTKITRYPKFAKPNGNRRRLYILELPDSDCKITILRIFKKIKARLEKCNRVFSSDNKIFVKELNRMYRTEKHNNQNKKLNGFKNK